MLSSNEADKNNGFKNWGVLNFFTLEITNRHVWQLKITIGSLKSSMLYWLNLSSSPSSEIYVWLWNPHRTLNFLNLFFFFFFSSLPKQWNTLEKKLAKYSRTSSLAFLISFFKLCQKPNKKMKTWERRRKRKSAELAWKLR